VPEESGQELRFGFVRGTDLLVAEFQLRNLRVTADGTRLEREVPGEPAHVIVWLPAQHVLEQALPMGDALFLTRVASRVTAKPPSAPSFSEGSDLDRPGDRLRRPAPPLVRRAHLLVDQPLPPHRSRHERLPVHHAAMVQWAMVIVMARRHAT
jgi:hypothetical protein